MPGRTARNSSNFKLLTFNLELRSSPPEHSGGAQKLIKFDASPMLVAIMVMYNSTLFIFTPEQYVKLFTFWGSLCAIKEEGEEEVMAEEKEKQRNQKTRRCSGYRILRVCETAWKRVKIWNSPIFSPQRTGTLLEVRSWTLSGSEVLREERHRGERVEGGSPSGRPRRSLATMMETAVSRFKLKAKC